jgi:molybdopterin-guanine dinucleotide biosynthesis protein A
VIAFAGAVLTGGRSSRMGRDKAFVELGGRPMAAIVLATLREAGASEVIAVGGDVNRLPGLGFDRAMPDLHPGEGPLGGVLTAFDSLAGTPVVVVMACDMPWVTTEAVRDLVAALGQHPAAPVAVGQGNGLEPMFAAWRPSVCRRPLAVAFAAGERAVQAALRGLPATVVSIDATILRSANRPDDLPG